MKGFFAGVIVILCLAAIPNPREIPELPPTKGIRWVVVKYFHDGDTFIYYDLYESPHRGRVPHVDTPELKYKDGRPNSAGIKARDEVKKLFPEWSIQRVEFLGRERYGVLADPLIDGCRPLSKWLVDNKLAKHWDGKGVKPKHEDKE